MHQETQLVPDTGLNRKPMQMAQFISDVVAWAQTKHQASSSILYTLKLMTSADQPG